MLRLAIYQKEGADQTYANGPGAQKGFPSPRDKISGLI